MRFNRRYHGEGAQFAVVPYRYPFRQWHKLDVRKPPSWRAYLLVVGVVYFFLFVISQLPA